eukprot:scaffold3838_cov183-Ochromonas_danica.AAC.3
MQADNNQDFCYDLIRQQDDWVLFKSKLSSYLTDLEGKMSESILIEAVKDLPRLERLRVYITEKFSDLSFATIIEYGYGLKKLWIDTFDRFCFSDEIISKIIRSCKMLEDLKIPSAGWESVLAVKHHSMLREVVLKDVKASREELSRLLLVNEKEGEEKCVWRRLRKGDIYLIGYRFYYRKTEGCWHGEYWLGSLACLNNGVVLS